MADIAKLMDEIKGLTVLELNNLVKEQRCNGCRLCFRHG